MDRWRVPTALAATFASIALVAIGCRTPVHNFAELDDPAPFVRARAAGLDGSVADARAIPALIAHLEDDDPVVRLSSHEALRERTGQDFGYIPYGTPEERSEAASRWRDWWQGQTVTPSGRWNRPRAGLRAPRLIAAGSTPRTTPPDRTTPAREGRPMPDRIAAPLESDPIPDILAPIRPLVLLLAYLGGLATWPFRALASARERPVGTLSVRRATVAQVDWLIIAGLPIVGLVHIGMGSFLSMQAYFGATFEAGVGPVVGVGLVRNGAPLLAGFILAGLMASRATVELRARPRAEIDPDPTWIPDRDVALGLVADDRPGPSGPRATLPRLIAAMLMGPVFAAWGAFVGSVIGYRIAHGVLGIPIETLLDSFAQMLWMRDVFGLLAKGMAFGAIAATVACFEGARDDSSPAHVAALRACCLAMALILVANLSWFLFAYLAGPAFGPTVLPT